MKKTKNLNFPFSKSFDWKQKKAPKNCYWGITILHPLNMN